ncbi:MAG: T9SS type A sorting domain-containing protein [Chloroherpetonaceae bacterium]
MKQHLLLCTLASMVIVQVSVAQVAQGPAFGSVPSGAVFSTEGFGNTDAVSTIPGINGRVFNAKNQPPPTVAPPDVPAPLAPEGSNYIEDPRLAGNALESSSTRPLLLATTNGVPQGSWIPPDPHCAVGPNHVIFVDNGRIRILDKKGNALRTINANTWYSNVQPGVGAFDCKILYDHHDNRWIMVWLDQDNAAQRGLFLLSVSDDENPLGTWYNWALPSNRNGNTLNGGWGDYQGVGFDSEAIYITANNFTFGGSYQYTTLRIIEKSQLYANTAGQVDWIDFWNLRDSGSDVFGIRPSIVWGNPGEYYLVSVPRFFSGNTYFTIFKLTNPTTTPQLSTVRVPVTAWSLAPNANQLGGSTTLLESGGSNVRNEPVYRDGHLYAVHAVASGTGNQFSSARYVKIRVSDNSVASDVAFGANGFWHTYPAIMVDQDDNLAITFSRSGQTEFIGAYYTWKLSSDATLRPSETIQAGRGNYVVTFGGTRNRWGDYNGIALDPNGSGIWMFTEYAAATNTWGNWLHGIRLKPFSGAAVYSFRDALTFGKVEVGRSDTLAVTIYSYGENALSISSMTTQTPAYQVVNAPSLPISLPLYDSLVIRVAFVPTQHGVLNDTLYIASNDAEQPVYKIALSGKGVEIGQAEAGVLYSLSSPVGDAQLVRINDVTAQAVSIGQTEQGIMNSMCVNPRTNELFGLTSGTPSVLHRISARFGDALPWRTIPLANVRAIAFGENDTLYAVLAQGLGTNTRSLIYRVLFNEQTTDTTLVANVPQFNPSGMTWDNLNRRLILSAAAGTRRDTIYTVNPNNGNFAPLGAMGLSVAVTHLGYAPNGYIFGLTGTGTQVGTLVRFTAQNTSAITIGSTNIGALRGIGIRTDSLGQLNAEMRTVSTPKEYALNQNYPNPFNPTTVIEFILPTADNVSLKIYDVLGREVATLLNERRNAGVHRVNFNAANLSSGTYFYRMQSGGFTQTKKMILVK